jgi:hypothetical protein
VSDKTSVEAAKSRATAAKAREIDAHLRAIKLHQDAVILFDRLHQILKSASAHQREQHAFSCCLPDMSPDPAKAVLPT